MNTDLLSCIFSHRLLNTIHKYAYPQINSDFIRKRLRPIFNKDNLSEKQWILLIRDSRKVEIQFEPEISNYNFSSFIITILENRQVFRECGPYFEQFCIQAIANNKQILMNKYHAGMGPGLAFDLIATYLQSTLVFSHYCEFPQIEKYLFNVLQYSIQNQCLTYDLIEECQASKVFYQLHLSFGPFITSVTAETIDLILLYIEKLVTNQHRPYYHNSSHSIFNQIQKLLQIYCGSVSTYLIEGRNILRPYSSQRYYQEKYPSVKKTFWQTLEILDGRHPQFISMFSKELKKTFQKQLTVELILDLFYLPNLCKLVLDEEYFYEVFSGRKVKIAELLWSKESVRQQIVGMVSEGKNILEKTAESYGLTHNIISLLWESGCFALMPPIRNKKSELIVLKKYGLSGNYQEKIEEARH